MPVGPCVTQPNTERDGSSDAATKPCQKKEERKRKRKKGLMGNQSRATYKERGKEDETHTLHIKGKGSQIPCVSHKSRLEDSACITQRHGRGR
jgi:hypothetical protein